MKQGFLNQKLRERNNRRNALLKAKAHGRPSLSKSQASKPWEVKGNRPAP
jgi:hypothetical protein